MTAITNEVALYLTPSIHGGPENNVVGEATARQLLDPGQFVYCRVQIVEHSTTWEAAVREAKAALRDLGDYIAGRDDPDALTEWTDSEGVTHHIKSASEWATAAAEAMAFQLGLRPPA